MGSGDLDGGGFERLLDDTRRALRSLRSAGAGGSTPRGEPAEPLRGEGAAAEGRISVSAVSGGRVEGLSVDPRLLRLGSEELCAHIVVAVNVALEDLRAQTSQVDAGGLDPAVLAGTLEGLQADSARQAVLQWAHTSYDSAAKAFGSFGDAIHTMADQYDNADQATGTAAKQVGKGL